MIRTHVEQKDSRQAEAYTRGRPWMARPECRLCAKRTRSSTVRIQYVLKTSPPFSMRCKCSTSSRYVWLSDTESSSSVRRSSWRDILLVFSVCRADRFQLMKRGGLHTIRVGHRVVCHRSRAFRSMAAQEFSSFVTDVRVASRSSSCDAAPDAARQSDRGTGDRSGQEPPYEGDVDFRSIESGSSRCRSMPALHPAIFRPPRRPGAPQEFPQTRELRKFVRARSIRSRRKLILEVKHTGRGVRTHGCSDQRIRSSFALGVRIQIHPHLRSSAS